MADKNSATSTTATASSAERKTRSSILSQISDVQSSLNAHYFRVETLEKALAFREMSVEDREVMEAELEAIKRLLSDNEAVLKQLQMENRQTPSLAWLIVLLCLFLFFGYTVVTNTIV